MYRKISPLEGVHSSDSALPSVDHSLTFGVFQGSGNLPLYAV